MFVYRTDSTMKIFGKNHQKIAVISRRVDNCHSEDEVVSDDR